MANNNDFKSVIALGAFILVLFISLAGYYGYNRYLVQEPLQEKLTEIPGVQEVEIKKSQNHYAIQVQMARVDNIQQSYAALHDQVDLTFKNKDFQINLYDQREQQLQDLYIHMQPYIYEALANHQYVWLNDTLTEQSTQSGFQGKFFLDENYLFIQIEDSDAYLYEVIKRPEKI